MARRRPARRPSGEGPPVYIGVIGCGEWGPNHIRNFNALPGCRVLLCADTDPERLERMRRLHPMTRGTLHHRELLEHPHIHAVVVATPTATHHTIVSEALEAGKDVLVEKPLADSLERARKLQAMARRRRRILMVGHTFLFNAGILELHRYIRGGAIGKLRYMSSTRTNLGPIRKDVSVVWDLAAHDVSIFNFLLGRSPRSVSARGETFIRRGIQDVAFINLAYPGKTLVNVRVSWLDPVKVREITVVGEKMMLVWNDLEAPGPIRIYDKKVVKRGEYASFGEFQLFIREGDLTIPRLALVEPLRAQSEHFVRCLRGRSRPLSDGLTGVQVVRVLEAIQESIRRGGAPVTLR